MKAGLPWVLSYLALFGAGVAHILLLDAGVSLEDARSEIAWKRWSADLEQAGDPKNGDLAAQDSDRRRHAAAAIAGLSL